MTVNAGLAHLSDTLFTTAIATYTLAMAGYTAEYAFGRKGRVSKTSASSAQVGQRVLVGANGLVETEQTPQTLPKSSVPRSDVPTKPPTSGRAPFGERMGRLALLITIVGVLLHTASVVIRGIAVDSVPWSNMYEFASVAGLVAVLALLAVLTRTPRIRYLGGFVMLPVIIVMFLAGTVLYSRAQPLVPALQSYWLAIHVTAAAMSEGILITSAVLTTLFLVRQRYDARIAVAGARLRWPVTLGPRLPAAETLDKVAYRTVAFAFPIYTFGIICGAIWAEAAWGRYWGWDPKETWAFIAWVIYAAYLHARATAGWKGRAAAWINLLGFGAMTFNFFVVNIVISGLHSYAGLN